MAEQRIDIETFIWKGQTRYRCPLYWESGAKCMFDTHEVELLKAHMTKQGHSREVASAPRSAPTLPVSTESHTTVTPTVDEEFKDVEFAPESGSHVVE